MINKYLSELDTFISTDRTILDVDVVRRDIRETGMEKTALYRYRLKLNDNSLVELTERLVEEKGQLRVTKYRFHWQDRSGKLIKRWDNAPHHPEIDSFPHHLHDGSESVVIQHQHCSAVSILMDIVEQVQPILKDL